MDLRPPPGFVERLRRAVGCSTLQVEIDPVATEKSGRPVWSVLYEEHGQPTWICDWQGPLDGALDGLAQRIDKYDYAKHNVPRYYARKLDAKMQAIRDAKARRRMDVWHDFASYSRRAFQAYVDGAPTVGTCESGPRR